MVVLYYPQNTPPALGRMPLSVLALAAVLEGKYEYRILDGNVNRSAFRELQQLLSSRSDIELLAVSVMPGEQMLNAITHTRQLKREFPHLTIVWGGYFPSIHTDATLNSDYVDFVIRGQGEQALPALIDSLRNGSSLSQIPHLSFRRDGRILHNGETSLYNPTNRPPLPYHRLLMDHYAIPTFVGSRTYCHETSVGCPHKCNFCGVVDVYNARWKAEPVEQTLETVRQLKTRYGMNGVEFHDSDFFVSQKRVAELSEKLIGMDIEWWGEGRIDTLLSYSAETWKLMRRSGLRMIFFGAESGLDETLQLMDKSGVTAEKTKAIAALCKEHSVRPEYSFVMGSNPHRTEEDIDATIRLMYELERINPDSQMHPFIYTPVPFGTIYDTAVEGGLQYPKNLDAWASHEWTQYALRQNPHTPWLTKRLRNKIVNFRAVHQSYYPKTNDRIIARWKLLLLRLLSAWRYRFRIHKGAIELRFLLRLLLQSPKNETF